MKFSKKIIIPCLSLISENKTESDILIDKLTLCLNWVSALTNQRNGHNDINYIPLKYKFPMSKTDSPLCMLWEYLHGVLMFEYNAVILKLITNSKKITN